MELKHILFVMVLLSNVSFGYSSPAIFITGCANSTSPIIINALKSNGTKYLIINNYPGTCLAYCERQNSNTNYIALKGELCLCGKNYSEDTYTSNGCNDTCPGHDDHVCGSSAGNLYSKYIIERSLNVSQFSCLQYEYDNVHPTLLEGDCLKPTPWLCFRLGVPNCGPKSTWSDSAKSMRDYSTCFPYKSYTTCHSMMCPTPLRIPSMSTCTSNAIFFIPAFGQWAPKKNCTLPATNVAYLYGNDNETIYYNCNKGYRLVGDINRSCMTNNRWSGIQPLCVPLNTTRTPALSTTAKATFQKISKSTVNTTRTPTLSTIQKKSKSEGKGGLSLLAIIGIAAGIFVCLAIGSFVSWRLKKRNNKVDDSNCVCLGGWVALERIKNLIGFGVSTEVFKRTRIKTA